MTIRVAGSAMDELARRPTSAMSEADLERAGLGRGARHIQPRTEPCVCGGEIRVEDRDDEWLVARAVAVHNESTAHRQWAIAAGWR